MGKNDAGWNSAWRERGRIIGSRSRQRMCRSASLTVAVESKAAMTCASATPVKNPRATFLRCGQH